ncbi:MAG: hypothetical protein HRT69_16005 [Flavobacteriaceae bacterium]|nr:hypothetical protein [Flavobacteriaceae bacterium]
MNLRTPKKIQSDCNRISAQRAVVLNDPKFNGEEEKGLVKTYDLQLEDLKTELNEAKDMCDFIEDTLNVKLQENGTFLEKKNIMSC